MAAVQVQLGQKSNKMSKLKDYVNRQHKHDAKFLEKMGKDEKVDELLNQLRRMISDSDDKVLHSWKFTDEFLLRFIRGRKYNMQSALEKLINNVHAKRYNYPEIFKTLYPSALEYVLQTKMMRILKHRDELGRHIVAFKPDLFDPNAVPLDDLLRYQIMIVWEMMSFKETQLKGIIVIVDGSGFSYKQVKVLTPFNVQKYVTLAVKCSPTRFKGCHILFLPQVMHFGLQMIKPLLPDKVRNRIFSHGNNLEEYYKIFPKNTLPDWLGGTLSDKEALDEDLENAILGKDAYYKDLIQ